MSTEAMPIVATMRMQERLWQIQLSKDILVARKQKGWTRERLAEEAGVSEPTLYKLEKAKGWLNTRVLLRIMDALDLELVVA